MGGRLALLAGFDLFWLLAVVRGDTWWPLLLLMLLPFWFHPAGSCRRRGYWLGLAIAGGLLDSLLIWLGVFQFPSSTLWVPPWLWLLWLGFVIVLDLGLGPWLVPRLLSGRGWQLALLGAISGPVAYLSAAGLQAVTLPQGVWQTGILLALIWMVCLPVLVWVLARIGDETHGCVVSAPLTDFLRRVLLCCVNSKRRPRS